MRRRLRRCWPHGRTRLRRVLWVRFLWSLTSKVVGDLGLWVNRPQHLFEDVGHPLGSQIQQVMMRGTSLLAGVLSAAMPRT
jgi:hypothetical protein